MSPTAALMLEKMIYPIIRNTVPQTAKPIGSEDYQELVQDATAIAAEMLDAMEKSGKEPIANSIAYYSIQRIKSGRRSCGNTRTDVMNPGYQLDNAGSVCSMQSPVSSEDEDLTVADMIAAKTEDVADKVLRQIDWESFTKTIDARKRKIVKKLMLGFTTSELAKMLSVSSARIVQLKREIAQDIRKFMGDTILVDSSSESVWQRDIRCIRERNEWKHTKLDKSDDPEAVNIAQAIFG
jgi:DNA-directed RNA polymerase specialized sigma24 family protein